MKLKSGRVIPVIFITAAAVFAIFVIFGGGGAKEQESVSADSQKFDALADSLFKSSLTDNTVNLHAFVSRPEDYGLENVPVNLGNISKEEFEHYNVSICNVLRSLNSINEEKLTQDRYLTWKILKTRYTDMLQYCDYYMLDEYLAGSDGQQNLLPVYLAEYSFDSEKDINDYLEILQLSEPFFDSILEFERMKADEGTFMNEFQADNVIKQCRDFISDTDNHYLITTFNEKVDDEDISEELKSQYKKKNKEYLNMYFFPVYEKIASTMERLKTQSPNCGGLCNYKNGKYYYEGLVRSKTGSQKNVDEICAMLENALAQDVTRIQELYGENPDIESQRGNFMVKYDDTNSIISNLYEDIQVHFPTPAVTYKDVKIHKVPEPMEDYEAPAYYLSPPIDCITKNAIYINGKYYSADDTDGLLPVLAHEGFPGHLYQTTYFRNTNPAPIRLIISFPGYSEGWATYAETYSYAVAGLDDDVAEYCAKFTTFSLELYSLFDIYTNYKGYDLQRIIEFGEQWGLDKSMCVRIYQTVIESPCDYLQYSVGYLEIMELRDYLSGKMGDEFSIKDFHKRLLEIGPAQFEVIRGEM